MTQHTPGPWVVTSGSPPMVIAPGQADICEMNGAASNESVMADAHLIAAAPETAAERDRLREEKAQLLAALDEMLDDIGRSNSMLSAVKARALIAKSQQGPAIHAAIDAEIRNYGGTA